MEWVHSSPRRLAFLAHHTVREAARQRAFHFLFLFAVVLIVGAHFMRDLHFGSSELKFLADLGFGAIGLFGAVLTVGATAQLFFSEIERRTILTLLAKPVGRSEFVLGKFAGVAVLTGCFCGLLTLTIATVLWVREQNLVHEGTGLAGRARMVNYSYLGLLGLMQWLKLLVLESLTLLVASYARSQLLTLVMGFLLFGLCHLQHFALAASLRPGTTATGVVTGWLARLLPNFQLFDLGETVGGGVAVHGSSVGWIAVYGLAYVTVACALATVCFRRREI